MAAQVFWAVFYSSRRPSQIGPTADFDGAAIPPPIFSMLSTNNINNSAVNIAQTSLVEIPSCRRTKFLLCSCAPVSWNAGRKPNGLDLIQPWSERKPVYQPFHLPCFLKFFHLSLSMMNIWPFKQLADLSIKSCPVCQGKKWMNFLIWSDLLLNSSLILSWLDPTIFLKSWLWNLLMFYSKLED